MSEPRTRMLDQLAEHLRNPDARAVLVVNDPEFGATLGWQLDARVAYGDRLRIIEPHQLDRTLVCEDEPVFFDPATYMPVEGSS